MSTEPQHPDTQPQPARQPTSHPRADSNQEERADIEQDRRQQRELDDAERGGEA